MFLKFKMFKLLTKTVFVKFSKIQIFFDIVEISFIVLKLHEAYCKLVQSHFIDGTVVILCVLYYEAKPISS